MTLDQAVALSLLDDLPRVGLTARLLESDPELVELAAPLLDRALAERLRAAAAGINVLAWNDPQAERDARGRTLDRNMELVLRDPRK